MESQVVVQTGDDPNIQRQKEPQPNGVILVRCDRKQVQEITEELVVVFKNFLGSVILQAQDDKDRNINVPLKKIDDDKSRSNPCVYSWSTLAFTTSLSGLEMLLKLNLQNGGPENKTTTASAQGNQWVLIETQIGLHPFQFPTDKVQSKTTESALALTSDLVFTGTDPTKELYNELEDSPPPGFERKLKYGESTRRSSRLQEKSEGRYISSIDKARAVLGYEDVQLSPKRVKRKSATRTEVKPTYLQSYDPLTDMQAQLVVNTTGVELNATMEEKIKKLAKGKEPAEGSGLISV